MSNDFDIDMDKARSFLAEKDAKRDAELDSSFQEATSDFDCIVGHIIKKYNPKRIWQWGSLLDRKLFSEISDIDIALEGISEPQIFFDIIGYASNLSRFPVDIVEIENVGKDNAEHILKKGRCVYERSR